MSTSAMWIGPIVLALLCNWSCGGFKRRAYEGWGRDAWQKPEEVVRVLRIEPGARVADVGAGGGYFTFRLADAVGAKGTVYAVDVDSDMTDYLRERAAGEGYQNVAVVLATPDDAGLPADGVDLIFTCNTYHHFGDPTAYFTKLKPALRPGGRVAIIDYKGEGFFGWLFGHATKPETITAQMQAAGYHLEQEYGFLPRQGFLVFVPVG